MAENASFLIVSSAHERRSPVLVPAQEYAEPAPTPQDEERGWRAARFQSTSECDRPRTELGLRAHATRRPDTALLRSIPGHRIVREQRRAAVHQTPRRPRKQQVRLHGFYL